MNVTAIIVTRGDHDLAPIIGQEWPEQVQEIIVWDNASEDRRDLKVYGRYAAIAEASHDLIFVQDDDVLLPRESLEQILRAHDPLGKQVLHDGPASYVTCNMPAAFRDQPQYERGEQSLVGFGACFHRDAPRRAFEMFATKAWDVDAPQIDGEDIHYVWEYGDLVNSHPDDRGLFLRTCDVVFTALTPRVWVDVPYENLPWATADDRMYRQPEHVPERTKMLELVRKVRDAG